MNLANNQSSPACAASKDDSPSVTRHSFVLCPVILLLALAVASCSSIAQHAGPPTNPIRNTPLYGVYPGVQGDWILFSAVFKSEYMNGPQSGANYIGCPYGFFDMPLSFVLDTVLLPADLARKSPKEEGESKKDHSPPAGDQ